jgi:hypothetical protein
MNKEKLIKRIEDFLAKYARKNNEGEYTSPDAYQLECSMKELKSTGNITTFPWSEWGSGGYHPYTSKKGFKEHETILKEIKMVMNNL